MRKRIILLIALLTVVLAFASCKNKTKYTVSVKLAEGEQLIGSITTEVGKKSLIGDVINETSVQKEGHIFKGWSIDGSSLVDKQLVITENILLIPIFEVNSYKIKYTIDGEVFSEELLKYGSKIEVKQVPEKTGYTFKGWDKELPNTMPANDIELIGTYEKNKYTITYIIEGQENITRTYYYGDTIETIENPKLEGLNFVKWSEIIPDTMPDHNIEVYAEFDKKSFNINYYIDDVLYKTDSYKYNDNIDALEMAEKVGYTFSGWDKELPTNMPAYDIDVYGTYNKNTYYINYYIDNVLYKTISYLYDNSIKVLEVTSKTGYTFSGWDKVLPTNMPAQDIDVYGTYNINTYQINYYIDNELYKTVNYKYNELINNLDVPEKSGYTFSGWDKKLPTNMPAENLNFYGSYVIATYQITYVYEEGNLPTHTLNTLEELSQVFWDEFYAWSGSTKSLEEFKTEHLTSWKTGNHGTSKLYLANGETKIDEGYFINASANNKKWVNFINVLDKMVNEINPSQHAWDSTYVGYLRLYTFFMQSATYWTTERTQKMVESIKIEDTLKKTYQKGDEFKFLELSIEDGREFLGWYLNEEKIEGITKEMTGDITIVAKWSNPILPESINILNPVSTFDKNITYTLQIELMPTNITHPQLVMKSSEPKVATINNGVIKTIGYGKTTITIYSKYNPNVKVEFELEVFPKILDDNPIIYLPYDVNEKAVINVGVAYDLLTGVKAYDKQDGDISESIKADLSELDDTTAGKYTIIYSVTDSDGNTSTFERIVVVVDRRELIFIGHAGCYLGIMNTEEAFINAAKIKKYDAIECDVKQTKDGVFVVCHDNDFAGISIANTNWEDLKNVTKTLTRGGVEYTATLCTFERYLEICKEYDLFAVVELKSSAGITNSDQSRMSALMEIINKKGMLDKTIFLGSQYKCLEWVKSNGYEYIPCQYLVNSCESETIFERCVTWNFDVSFNISYSNSAEWIARYHEAGLKVSCYTFSQYSDAKTLQEWINKDVDFVTCDVLTREDVVIPDRGEIEDKPTYMVIFKDYDGTILKEATVTEGKNAIPPFSPKRKGYTFIGWDKTFNNVNSNFEVTAQYEITTYTITYHANLNKIEESSWASKQEFVNEFYTDLYNWLVDNINNISELTLDNGTYSLTKNGSTATFKNVEELMAIDKSIFELTISNYFYKPLTENSKDLEMPEDDNYFLNSKKYRLKYKALNAWFLNCIENTSNYVNYNKTWTPTTKGKVQIIFRFHQWQQGTNIAAFNNLPAKYNVVEIDGTSVDLPQEGLTFTINDSFVLPEISMEGYEFVGWFIDSVGSGEKVTEISLGTTGDLHLYAKWLKLE